MCEQVGDCIRNSVDERSGATRCGRFDHIDLSRVITELVLVMEEVGEQESLGRVHGVEHWLISTGEK